MILEEVGDCWSLGVYGDGVVEDGSGGGLGGGLRVRLGVAAAWGRFALGPLCPTLGLTREQFVQSLELA